MIVRRALLFLIALTAACGAPQTERPRGPDRSAEVVAIADAIVDDHLAQSPDLVALLRPPGARYDDLPRESLADQARRDAQEDAWRTKLASIDRAALREPAALAYDIATETLAARKEARVCRYELWSVRPMGGIQVQLANLVQAQPLGTPDLRAQAVARFSKVPAYVATHIENLREGLRLGYTQNDGNVRQIIDQLDRLTTGDTEASPFFHPATVETDPEFRATWTKLVRDEVTPALAKFRDFLRDEYLPRARKAFGVSANPNGAECYRASIRLYTTLPLDAKAVHDSGLAVLERVEKEMSALSTKSFGGEPVATVLQRFTKEPAYLHKDAADVTALATAAVTRAQAAIPKAFGILPTAPVAIEPIPKFQERTSSAHYRPAALDGSRAATYRIRLYEPEKTSVVLGESTAFHEAFPGHHLQVNIANGRAQNPRIARFLFNSGYGEGWALYAERLADELGLYSNDASRMGMLSNAAWRACRLIVDTGLHAFGWDRDRAIALMLQHTAMSPAQAAQEVDRYISWPGQATSYMTGYLEIASLRRAAEKTLGPRFDRRAFHDRVLENGAVPLPVLRRRVEAWIATSR